MYFGRCFRSIPCNTISNKAVLKRDFYKEQARLVETIWEKRFDPLNAYGITEWTTVLTRKFFSEKSFSFMDAK